VTELKSSHEALAAKEEELQVVVESAPDTVLMTDETRNDLVRKRTGRADVWDIAAKNC